MPFSASTHPLDSGATFPPLRLTTSDDRTIDLPARSGKWTVVLIYRGQW